MRGKRAGPAIAPQLRAQVDTKLLPGVLQTLALPQVAHTEVAATVEVALLENPMLERNPGHPCPECGRHTTTARCGLWRLSRCGWERRRRPQSSTSATSSGTVMPSAIQTYGR